MIVYFLHNFSISLSINTYLALGSLLVFDPFGLGLNKILFIILLSVSLKF